MVCVIAGKDQLTNVVPPSSSGGGERGIDFWCGGNKILVGGGGVYLGGGNFPGGEGA